MFDLGTLHRLNRAAEAEARAAARRQPDNQGRFRVDAERGSQRLLVFHKEQPRLRVQTTDNRGNFFDIPPRDSELQLAHAIQQAPILHITRAWDDTSPSLRRAHFCVDRDAGGFSRWNGTVGFQIATGFAAMCGTSRETFEACFERAAKVVHS